MDQPSADIVALFNQARDYDQRGDAYNAVKLYKKVARLAPEWAPPMLGLGGIYKARREWKPAMHYFKKAVALDSTLQSAWWDLGIAATALKRPRLAKVVWNKFGFERQAWKSSIISIRLAYQGQFEILQAETQGPARAIVRNIPHPASGLCFLDQILVDRSITGYHVVGQKRSPVYDELGLLQRSGYHTYSCVLSGQEESDIHCLEQLCREAGLGFEVWSNATRQYQVSSSKTLVEYYGPEFYGRTSEGGALVALAAREEKNVLEVLRAWELISLQTFTALQFYHR